MASADVFLFPEGVVLDRHDGLLDFEFRRQDADFDEISPRLPGRRTVGVLTRVPLFLELDYRRQGADDEFTEFKRVVGVQEPIDESVEHEVGPVGFEPRFETDPGFGVDESVVAVDPFGLLVVDADLPLRLGFAEGEGPAQAFADHRVFLVVPILDGDSPGAEALLHGGDQFPLFAFEHHRRDWDVLAKVVDGEVDSRAAVGQSLQDGEQVLPGVDDRLLFFLVGEIAVEPVHLSVDGPLAEPLAGLALHFQHRRGEAFIDFGELAAREDE